MRYALTALAAISTFASGPAFAAEGDAEQIAEKLADPALQAEVAKMAETMTAVMLDMPVGPMARAAAELEGKDPEAVDPDLTVRDLAGPEAADAPREIAVRVPQMMAALATLAVALEEMLPQLRAIGERMAAPPVESHE
jgi:hypothetical protein